MFLVFRQDKRQKLYQTDFLQPRLLSFIDIYKFTREELVTHVLRSCGSKPARSVLLYYLTADQYMKCNQMYHTLFPSKKLWGSFFYSVFYINLDDSWNNLSPFAIKHPTAKQASEIEKLCIGLLLNSTQLLYGGKYIMFPEPHQHST